MDDFQDDFSLDDHDPVPRTSTSSKGAPITARNRPARPRFLGDSEDEGSGSGPPPARKGREGRGEESRGRSGGASDVDALFDGLDDLDDEPQMPDRLNGDEGFGKRKQQATLDPLNFTDAADPLALDSGDGAAPKRRRTVVKLDESRLLADSGFPALIAECKKFKPKGKGHEMEDLGRLLKVYRLWAHRMYPKTNFAETIETVEKVCHKRRMQSALREWRDEAHGIVKKSHTDTDPKLDAALDATESGPQGLPDGSDGEAFDNADFDLAPTAKAQVLKGKRPLFAPDDEEPGGSSTAPSLGDDMPEDWELDGMEDTERFLREAEEAEAAMDEIEREALGVAGGHARLATAPVVKDPLATKTSAPAEPNNSEVEEDFGPELDWDMTGL